MVQEVRSILFTAEEAHDAVAHLLVMRRRGLRPEQIIRVELGDGASGAEVTLGSSKLLETHRIDAAELMSAVLLFCRRAHIPLSSRSHKRLGMVAGCLALTTSINPRTSAPKVDGGTVVHALSGPDLAVLHSI